MKKGWNVAIFSAGKRETDAPFEFERGTAAFGLATGKPIVPLGLPSTLGRILPKGGLVLERGHIVGAYAGDPMLLDQSVLDDILTGKRAQVDLLRKAGDQTPPIQDAVEAAAVIANQIIEDTYSGVASIYVKKPWVDDEIDVSRMTAMFEKHG